MGKAKKLKSGSWRAQVYSHTEIRPDGTEHIVRQSFTADTAAEAELLAAKFKASRVGAKKRQDMTLGEAFDQYIAGREAVLSPSTIQGYKKIRRNDLQELMHLSVNKIDQRMVSAAISRIAKTKSPKTVSNIHGLLASVLRDSRPDLILRTTLPKVQRRFVDLPEPAEVMEIVRGEDIELPVLLAMWLTLTVSEIRGLTKRESISRDFKTLTVKSVVVDIGGEAVRKSAGKTQTRLRRLSIPPYIADLIRKCPTDALCPISGQALYKRWIRLQQRKGVEHPISFHQLRHMSASVMAMLGVPDVYAQERGGWKTDKTMRTVYTHTFSAERMAIDSRIDEYFSQLLHTPLHTNEKKP